MISFQFQKGNKPAGCEDAEPISNSNYAIICDGLGGSGSTKYQIVDPVTGELVTHTSAYWGSRTVSRCVNEYFDTQLEAIKMKLMDPLSRMATANCFVDNLKNKLVEELNSSVSKMGIEIPKSRALKALPTTLVSLIYLHHDGVLTIFAIWAGDSRAYILTPSKGLQLISRDDADNADDEMNSGSSMNNCISAGNEFHLNYSFYTITEPAIAFCCSDGCFDYMRSPLHLEWTMLTTILEYIPSDSDGDLGELLASSIENTMYQSIGDDTTMAGICHQIDSVEHLKALFKTRMDSFNEKALNMNNAMLNLKKVQTEKEAAQKTCRLLEGKTNDAIKNAICEALDKHYPSPLYSYLCSQPYYKRYEEMESNIISEVNELCSSELADLQVKIGDLRTHCIHLLKLDYLKWQRMLDEENPGGGGWRGRIQKSQKKTIKSYNSTVVASKYLEACVELFKRPELSEIVDFPAGVAGDYEEFVRKQIEVLGNTIAYLKNSDSLFTNLWSQAYFSTSSFEDEAKSLDYNPEFLRSIEYALKNPNSCDYVSQLTKQSIGEYQQLYRKIDDIRERHNSDRQRRLKSLPQEFYNSEKDNILNSLLSLNSEDIRSLLGTTGIQMDRIINFFEAKKKLAGIETDIANAQCDVNKIWDMYRLNYELFKKIEEKGMV